MSVKKGLLVGGLVVLGILIGILIYQLNKPKILDIPDGYSVISMRLTEYNINTDNFNDLNLKKNNRVNIILNDSKDDSLNGTLANNIRVLNVKDSSNREVNSSNKDINEIVLVVPDKLKDALDGYKMLPNISYKLEKSNITSKEEGTENIELEDKIYTMYFDNY